jgi:small subunit ribosomal protein S16
MADGQQPPAMVTTFVFQPTINRATITTVQEERVSVRIRMKMFGRKHRPYYRICAMDIRRPRDGRVLEELGTYDPLVPETDARAVLNGERIAHWLSVGAQPSDKVRVLIKKYGAGGTRVAEQQSALDRLAQSRRRPEPPPPPPRAEKPAKPADEETEKPAKRRRKPVAPAAEEAKEAAEPAAAPEQEG